jgi:hypothetical protein
MQEAVAENRKRVIFQLEGYEFSVNTCVTQVEIKLYAFSDAH